MKLRVIVGKIPPFTTVIKKGNVNDIEGSLGGILFRIFRQVLKAENVTQDIEVIDGGHGTGIELSKGNWSGPMGMMIRKEGDVLIPFTNTWPHIFDLISFSNPVGSSRFGVLSGPTSHFLEQNKSFLSSLGIPFILLLVSVWIIISLVSTFFRNEKRILGHETSHEDSFLENVLTFYGLMFERGSSAVNGQAQYPARSIIYTSWLLMSVVIMCAVEGTIFSSLTVPDLPDRIDDIENILKYPQLKPYIMEGFAIETFLRNSPLEKYRKVEEQVQSKGGVRNMQTFFQAPFMQQVKDGKAVIVSSKDSFLLAMVNKDCQRSPSPFYLSKGTFLEFRLTIVFRKGLEHYIEDALQRGVIRYGGMGFLSQTRKMESVRAFRCLNVQEDLGTISALSLKQLGRSFTLLCYGLALSVLVLIYEMMEKYLIRVKANMKNLKNRAITKMKEKT